MSGETMLRASRRHLEVWHGEPAGVGARRAPQPAAGPPGKPEPCTEQLVPADAARHAMSTGRGEWSRNLPSAGNHHRAHVWHEPGHQRRRAHRDREGWCVRRLRVVSRDRPPSCGLVVAGSTGVRPDGLPASLHSGCPVFMTRDVSLWCVVFDLIVDQELEQHMRGLDVEGSRNPWRPVDSADAARGI